MQIWEILQKNKRAVILLWTWICIENANLQVKFYSMVAFHNLLFYAVFNNITVFYYIFLSFCTTYQYTSTLHI